MKKSTIQLHDIKVENNKVIYDYSYSSDLKIYFKNKEKLYVTYDFEVSAIPKSVLAIPWLANFITISWFSGCTIIIDEIDDDFLECLEILKKSFAEEHVIILAKNSNLLVNKSIKNTYAVDKEAMLFSGGLDAWTTFLKHKEKKLDLITIQGSDIELGNVEKMNLIRSSYQENSLLTGLPVHFIASNFRDFHTRHLEKLIYFNYVDWWTMVQFGIVLTASTAPLAYYYGFSNVFIASSLNEKEDMVWGSSKLDNHIKFGNTTITHDGQEFNRFQKTEFVVKHVDNLDKTFPLRVCYKHNFSGLNCGKCAKCLRMIISLILKNKNPNDFGFNVNKNVYDLIFNQLTNSSFGFREYAFWQEIDSEINNNIEFYVFENEKEEKEKILHISSLFNKINANFPSKTFKIKRLKNKLRNKWLLWKVKNIL